MSSSRGSHNASPKTIIALYKEVRSALRKWKKGSGHDATAKRLVLLLRALRDQDEDAIRALSMQLEKKAIKGFSEGALFELGPRGTRGGAARIFWLSEAHYECFVAADVEKSNTGARAIGRAKRRSKQALDIIRDARLTDEEKKDRLEDLKYTLYR